MNKCLNRNKDLNKMGKSLSEVLKEGGVMISSFKEAFGGFDLKDKRTAEEKHNAIVDAIKNPTTYQKQQMENYEKKKKDISGQGFDCGPCNCALCGSDWYGATQGPQICRSCIEIYESGNSLFPFMRKK
jgi:hypothetical protein